MRVRLLIGLSGNEYTLSPGDERDFPSEEATRLVSAGIAIPVAAQEMERAVVVRPAAEKRARKTKANVVSNDNRDAA